MRGKEVLVSHRSRKSQLWSTAAHETLWVGLQFILLANSYNLGYSESCPEKMKAASVVKGEWNRIEGRGMFQF
jgi:hypothetical protein